jgi:hypothetical protein
VFSSAYSAVVYIGEAALTLVQNVDYEVPYLRKQAQKAMQSMEDSDRRHAEYLKGAAQCATAFQQVGGWMGDWLAG